MYISKLKKKLFVNLEIIIIMAQTGCKIFYSWSEGMSKLGCLFLR